MTRSLAEVIDELGNCGDIARFLGRAGVKGNPTVSCSCPVANYVRQETGAARVDVDARLINARFRDSGEFWVSVPKPVRQFISDFDSELYPELIAR